MEDVRRWHVEDNKWSDIGYHFVIEVDGTIARGRPIVRSGAHAKGFNSRSIGICLIGTDVYSGEQILALKNLLIVLKNKYRVADKQVIGHYEVQPGKTCPGILGEDIRAMVRTENT